MKHIIILGDGMADEPIEALGGLTPLQAASTPTLDRLTTEGRMGTLTTVPFGFHPGSEVAHLSLLGYDLPTVYEGRGSLEAASIGVPIDVDEIAMRCNIVCIEGDTLKNHSGGHLSDDEAKQLIDALNDQLGDDRIRFFQGVDYRHVLKIKGGNKFIDCTPPHDVPGAKWRDVLVKPEVPQAQDTAQLINDLIVKSQAVLGNHPVNVRRAAEGRDKANSIWPWSAGYRPSMVPMSELFGIKRGAVISAVDLIRGIGIYAGLDVIHVDGITGMADTNYEGKAQAAIEALRGDYDFVFVHLEASDEAGHDGEIDLKVRTIEYLDSRVLKPIVEAVEQMDEPVAIAVMPDHPTPCLVRTHTGTPVPFMIHRPGDTPDSTRHFNEIEALSGCYGHLEHDEFIKLFLQQ